MKLNEYLRDGAGCQARAVLAYLQQYYSIEESWNDEHKYYQANIEVCRWENGREQGYIVSMRTMQYKKQINIAFFEHRNSDNICAVMWEQKSFNSIATVELAQFGDDVYKTKWDVSKEVGYGEALKMADWIWDQLKEFWKNAENES